VQLVALAMFVFLLACKRPETEQGGKVAVVDEEAKLSKSGASINRKSVKKEVVV